MHRYQKFKSLLMTPAGVGDDADWWPGDWWEEMIAPQISELMNSFVPHEWET